MAPVAIGVLAGAYLGTQVMARMRNTTVRKRFLPWMAQHGQPCLAHDGRSRVAQLARPRWLTIGRPLTHLLRWLRLGLFLAVATIGGALTGAVLAGVVPTRWLELTLGLALSYSAFTTIRQLEDELPQGASEDRLAVRFSLEGTYHDMALRREVPYRARRVAGGFVAMYGAGLLSGMLGIGSGAFKVLAMDYLMRLPMKVSTATSNFMIGLTAAASAGIYWSRGEIHTLVAAPVAIGVLMGAYLGTAVMARLRNTTVRKLFLPIVVYLAVSMILRALGIHLP